MVTYNAVKPVLSLIHHYREKVDRSSFKMHLKKYLKHKNCTPGNISSFLDEFDSVYKVGCHLGSVADKKETFSLLRFLPHMPIQGQGMKECIWQELL